jgi:hypothetical protein
MMNGRSGGIHLARMSQVLSYLTHASLPQSDRRSVSFPFANTDLWAELEVADAENECFRERKSLITRKAVMPELLHGFKQDQDPMKRDWAYRVGKQQIFLLFREAL